MSQENLEVMLRKSLSLIDPELYDRFCEDGQRALNKIADRVGYDKDKFIPNEDYTASVDVPNFTSKEGLCGEDVTAFIILKDKDGCILYEGESDGVDVW